MNRVYALLTATVFATSVAQAQEVAPSGGALPSAEHSYAADNGLSVEEARRRLDQMREGGRLAAQLRDNESDTFGGMYVDHGPEFKIVALFTQHHAAKLRKYNAPTSVVGKLSKESEKALQEQQRQLLKVLRENGARVAAQTRIRTGEIDLYTDDENALNAAVSKARIKLDSKIKVKKVRSLNFKGEAAIYGGYALNEGTAQRCTAGYALTDGTNRYLATAGHCPDTLNYNGISLPFWFQWYEVYNVYDFQVHRIGTNTVSSSIYVGSSTLQNIRWVYSYSSMYEGEYVCKYGQVTRFTCGYITSLNYSALDSGGFVRVEKDGANLSEPGDSGGPWYLSTYEEAWGIHSDSPADDPNDAFFMPASRFPDANLRVLTSQ